MRLAVLLSAGHAPTVTGRILDSGVRAAGGQGVTGNVAISANPIRKVVKLLQNMAHKVEEEGKKEKELYDKFSCYCKTGAADLTVSIGSSNAQVPALQTDIEEGKSTIERLKQELKQHAADRTAAQEAVQEAATIREKDNAAYVKESGELKSYVTSLSKAIPAIESGMAGTKLLQVVGGNVAALRHAATADSQLTAYDRKMVLAFLAGGAATDRYVPKGGEIVGILKDMLENFEADLAAVEKKESEAVALHDQLVAAKTKEVEVLGSEIEKKTARVGDLGVEVVRMEGELSAAEQQLIADQKFLKDLESDCEGKQAEYDERVKTRAEELLAIHDTIKILNDDDALDMFKKTLPSSSFVQFESEASQAIHRALAVLHHKSVSQAVYQHDGLDLRFLEAALEGRKVDFSKVIKMIDDMLALLKQEQLDDASKKDYCNAQLDTSEDKQKELTRKIDDLDMSIDQGKAAIKQFVADIKALQDGIRELDRSVEDATMQRKAENEEFSELIATDSSAKELLQFAKTRLNKFYNPKLALLGQVGARRVSLLATARRAARGEVALLRDAPAPPPETWDAYQKKSEEGAGVIQMLDLLIRDLEKEMTEAKTQEAMAQKTYEDLMNDSAAKRARDAKTVELKEASKADSEELLNKAEGDLSATKQEFLAMSRYTQQLHAECDWLLQNFDLRQSARAEEADNLKQAKAILSGADFSLAQVARSQGPILTHHATSIQ